MYAQSHLVELNLVSPTAESLTTASGFLYDGSLYRVSYAENALLSAPLSDRVTNSNQTVTNSYTREEKAIKSVYGEP